MILITVSVSSRVVVFSVVCLFISIYLYLKSGTTTIQEGSITRGTPTNKVSVETIPSLRGSITQVFSSYCGQKFKPCYLLKLLVF